MKNPISLLMITLLIVSLGFSSVALAHSCYIKAHIEKDQVIAQCYYFGDKPMKDAKFRALDEQGMEIVKGKTDENGQYKFDVPPKGTKVKLIVQDLMGHRAEFELPLKEQKK